MGNKSSRKGRHQSDAALILTPLDESHDHKILFLGTANSGKTTIYKQMLSLCQSGETLEKDLPRQFMLSCLRSLVAARKKYLENSQNDADDDVQWLEQPGAEELLSSFWLQEATQRAFADKYRNHVPENVEYFLSTHAQRILAPNYEVEVGDVLRCYLPTTSNHVTKIQFFDSRRTAEVYDVGGQRSARKKWIHTFEKVDVIIYCASLVDYDVTLVEDDQTNAMSESIRLWQEIKNAKWFQGPSVRWILIFTKLDLFEEKIAQSPLSNTFPTYTGPNEVHQSAEFIRQQYLAASENTRAHVSTHCVCSVDEAMMSNVFSAIKDYIFTSSSNYDPFFL
eukprot:TRINITY_DN15228_c0_g1_i1.p1 TRINITY_DN15228_c0_g1~~TRINITY_DN15228_c0_g1_i1.p1  ORF type:complete len:337 (+),score=47.83 TRINITY_DN15228_c0_g1_i1:3-1013(+)